MYLYSWGIDEEGGMVMKEWGGYGWLMKRVRGMRRVVRWQGGKGRVAHFYFP